MIHKTWLLSDEERAEAERKGKQSILAHLICLRFPKATPAFVKKASTPFNDAYVDEIISAIATINTLEEFKRKVRELIPAC